MTTDTEKKRLTDRQRWEWWTLKVLGDSRRYRAVDAGSQLMRMAQGEYLEKAEVLAAMVEGSGLPESTCEHTMGDAVGVGVWQRKPVKMYQPAPLKMSPIGAQYWFRWRLGDYETLR